MGIFSCGQVTADREAALMLVRLGQPAALEIEHEIDTLETTGNVRDRGWGWLLLVYAKIKGQTAYPRLQRMARDPRFALLQIGLDNSIALALSLTSYVSDAQPLARRFRCRPEHPRDVLDQFILAWERGDLI